MKKIIILSLAIALGFSGFTASANDHQTAAVKEKKSPRPTIQGPAAIYLSGGTYTYTYTHSNLIGDFPGDAMWSVSGTPSIQFPADQLQGGATSITFNAADFASGSTGIRTIYLVGSSGDGLFTILASKNITVYN
ncbi:hypothetical protein TH53_16135 [Pedobacter lusitanus]|uniref:Uncharacterized protein n=1 Tax=Pedobacter lusitanus TaxID=1503925 RepID=A0A0D0GP08_9SPHI|nr:hypothetical protein [Pedobacter lusitanus]KIO76241.1 hypothetical protein TH53_16135 [Pedobacter lusitanus]